MIVEKIVNAYNTWKLKPRTEEEYEFDAWMNRSYGAVGFIGGYRSRDAEVANLRGALSNALTQLEQVQGLLDDDKEIVQAIIDAREALKEEA